MATRPGRWGEGKIHLLFTFLIIERPKNNKSARVAGRGVRKEDGNPGTTPLSPLQPSAPDPPALLLS